MGLLEKIREFFEPHIEVTVVKGDSMWAIAERFTGDGNNWTSLSDANPGVDKDMIRPGQKLRLPAEWLD